MTFAKYAALGSGQYGIRRNAHGVLQLGSLFLDVNNKVTLSSVVSGAGAITSKGIAVTSYAPEEIEGDPDDDPGPPDGDGDENTPDTDDQGTSCGPETSLVQILVATDPCVAYPGGYHVEADSPFWGSYQNPEGDPGVAFDLTGDALWPGFMVAYGIRSRNKTGISDAFGQIYFDFTISYPDFTASGGDAFSTANVVVSIPLGTDGDHPYPLLIHDDTLVGGHFKMWIQVFKPDGGGQAAQCMKQYPKFAPPPPGGAAYQGVGEYYLWEPYGASDNSYVITGDMADLSWSPLFDEAHVFNAHLADDLTHDYSGDQDAGNPYAAVGYWGRILGFNLGGGSGYDVFSTLPQDNNLDPASNPLVTQGVFGTNTENVVGTDGDVNLEVADTPVIIGLEFLDPPASVVAGASFTVNVKLINLFDGSDYTTTPYDAGGTCLPIGLTMIPDVTPPFTGGPNPGFTTDGGAWTSAGNFAFSCVARRAGTWFYEYTNRGGFHLKTNQHIVVTAGSPAELGWDCGQKGEIHPGFAFQGLGIEGKTCDWNGPTYQLTCGDKIPGALGKVVILDAYQNICHTATNEVTVAFVAKVDGSFYFEAIPASTVGRLVKHAHKGVANFGGLKLTGLGFEYDLTATSPGLVPAYHASHAGSKANVFAWEMDMLPVIVSMPATVAHDTNFDVTIAIGDVNGATLDPTPQDGIWVFDGDAPFDGGHLKKAGGGGAPLNPYATTSGVVTITLQFHTSGTWKIGIGTDYDSYGIAGPLGYINSPEIVVT